MEINEKAREIVKNTENLPTLPDVIVKITALIDDPDSTADDLNKVISGDLALTSKILKIVNSAFYGFSRNIGSITHAVVILGFNTVRNIALSAFIFDNLTSKTLQPLWEHSIAVGAISKAVGEEASLPQSEEAFIAGLLHDIGRVVLFVHDPEGMQELIEANQDRKDGALHDAEIQKYGCAQYEIGAALLDHWKLPEPLIESVLYIKEPSKASSPLSGLVCIGNILAKAMGIGTSYESGMQTLSPELLSLVGIEKEQIKALKPKLESAIESAGVFTDML